MQISNHYQQSELTCILELNKPISKVFDQLNDKKGDKTKFNADKFVILTV